MEEYTNIKEDLEIIEDIFFQTEEDKNIYLETLGLSEEEFNDIKSGKVIPHKIQLENIYNFAYANKLYLNEITWQEAIDLYETNITEVVAHGARTNIKGNIRLDLNGESNDFANGFYIGEDIQQAGMWVADEIDSSLYILTFDKSNLREARFKVDTEWMLAVAYYRDKLNDYTNNPKIQSIIDKVNNCDYIYAPIADNNLFEVIDAFSEGLITDLQCLYAISATHLGYQYVIKSQKALEQVDIKNHLYYCSIEKAMYNRAGDVQSNTSMNKALIAKKKYANQGQYISELLGEHI